MTGGLTLDLGGLTTGDALEVADRLRRIAEASTTPADRRTAARLAEIAEALEVAACDPNAPTGPDRDTDGLDGP
jgi:hypothetical protein